MPTPSTARMHDFEVVSNQEIAEGIFSLVISAPKLASALKPGQFVNIAVPGDASSLLRVPLSFYRADAQAGTVELWYTVVGDDTRRLSQMASGSTSNLLGPGGRGWLVPEGAKKALIVAGGIGVPPVLCLAGIFNCRIHITNPYHRKNGHHHFLLNKQMLLGNLHDDDPDTGIRCDTQLIQDITGALSHKGCLRTSLFIGYKRYQLLQQCRVCNLIRPVFLHVVNQVITD